MSQKKSIAIHNSILNRINNLGSIKNVVWENIPVQNVYNLNSPIIIDTAFNNRESYDIVLPEHYSLDFPDIHSEDSEIVIGELVDFLNNHFECLSREYPIYTVEYFKYVYNVSNKIIITIKSDTGQIVGFIGAVLKIFKCYARCVQSYHIMHLCTHKRLRKKQMAKVLMKAICNEIHCKKTGTFFSTSLDIIKSKTPCLKPFYWMYRPLNIPKLCKRLFHKWPLDKQNRLIKDYQLKYTRDISLIRVLTPEDILDVYELYTQDIEKYNFAQMHTLETFTNTFGIQHGFIDTFVITDKQGFIKDFISFYTVTVKPDIKHSYLFYATYETDKIFELILLNVLYIAEKIGIDMFFVPSCMAFHDIICKSSLLKFKKSEFISHYNLLNISGPQINSHEIGFITPN